MDDPQGAASRPSPSLCPSNLARQPSCSCACPTGHALPDHPLPASCCRPLTGAAQAPTDIHGTWTAEIHTGKVFLQVRTAPPPDWNRSGNWNGDWSMGQSLAVEELRRAGQQRPVHHGVGEVRPAPRGRHAGVRGRRSATAAAPGSSRFAPRDGVRRRDARPRLQRRPAALAALPAGASTTSDRSTSAT